jgi:type IV pilus assembly protein PilA
LVELLAVMVILGILAAVVLPAFFNQRDKAVDAEAKSIAHTAMVAMESCSVDANDGYESCDLERLRSLEPTLPGGPVLEVSGLGKAEYTIAVQTSPPGHTFTIEHASGGGLAYTCVVEGEGGCPAGGVWG